MNTVVLFKLPKIPLLGNKKSQIVHRISSLSQVLGLTAYKLRPVIGGVHGLTLVPKYSTIDENGEPHFPLGASALSHHVSAKVKICSASIRLSILRLRSSSTTPI